MEFNNEIYNEIKTGNKKTIFKFLNSIIKNRNNEDFDLTFSDNFNDTSKKIIINMSKLIIDALKETISEDKINKMENFDFESVIQDREIGLNEFPKKNEINSNEHINLENEIINILLKAEKKYCEFFKIKWNNLKRYLEIPGKTRWAKMIFNSKLIAATNNVMILLFEHEPSANILNDENKNQDFVNLMYEIFGQDVLFLGVWIDVWEKIKSDFIYKKNNNQLPKYMDVFIPKAIIEKKDSQNKELNEIQNIFDENIAEEVE